MKLVLADRMWHGHLKDS